MLRLGCGQERSTLETQSKCFFLQVVMMEVEEEVWRVGSTTSGIMRRQALGE